MSKPIKARTLALVAEIDPVDPVELAVRIAEAVLGSSRPLGLTAQQVLDLTRQQGGPDWLSSAQAAAEYIVECINAGQEPS
jgi:hypothetical protein